MFNLNEYLNNRISEIEKGIDDYNKSNQRRTQYGHAYWTYCAEDILKELKKIKKYVDNK